MPSLIKNSDTEAVLREILLGKGFHLSDQRGHGETGVDIRAEKDGETTLIEVIGFKSSPPARARDFFEVFFRAASRIQDDGDHVVIAMPDQARAGLPARAQHYGVAWLRLGKAFPEIEIWLVDTETQSYDSSSWNSWAGA